MAAQPSGRRKILVLGKKHFRTGIAPGGAYDDGALLYFAPGINVVPEAGVRIATRNYLLQSGAVGVSITGLVDSVIAAATYQASSANAYFMGDAGHLYQWLVSNFPSSTLSDKRSGTPISSPTTGLEIFQPKGGSAFLYYWQQSQIGRWDLASAYPTGWTDNWQTSGVTTDYLHPTHRYFDRILYGNRTAVGQLKDDGASGVTHTSSVLDIPANQIITDISDDGIYAVIAVTDNIVFDQTIFPTTKVLFWDGNASSWLREYAIPDPFIYALEKTPDGTFAFGITGIWQVTFNGIKKILSLPPNVYTLSANTNNKGHLAVSHFGQSALTWGALDGSNLLIKTYGKLANDKADIFLHPFVQATGSSAHITYCDGNILKGNIIAADDTFAMKAFPFSATSTPATGTVAQTVYLPLGGRYQIEMIRIILSQQMASGDSLTFSATREETGVSGGTGSFDAMNFTGDGAIRAKNCYATGTTLEAENLSLAVTFAGGVCKIQQIEVWGTPMPI